MRAITLFVVFLILAACAQRTVAAPTSPEEGKRVLHGKAILMVIAHRNFRDEELQKPRAIFEKAGAAVRVASSDMSACKGMLGAVVKPDLLVKDAKAADYDAIVFVGGSGATECWSDPKALALAKDAYQKGKVVAAICIAPVTLANAGLLSGKRATVWASEARRLKDKGAKYTDSPCVTDGRIVTANGPDAADEFGRAVVQALQAARR
jgi:protease I